LAKSEQKPKRRRFGFHRWLIVLLIVVNVLLVRVYSPILPHIQVPAENVAGPFNVPLLGELYLTNTLVATFIGALLLILVAFSVRRGLKKDGMILTGLAGIVEVMMEALYNLTESTAGKHARRIFPWVATIVLVVLLANWMELIPGVDSIGWLHEVHGEVEGYAKETLFEIGNVPVSTIVRDAAEAGDDHGEGHQYHVIPFVRVASTDLNFTVAIALVSVLATQVIGVRAQGLGYFKKFINFGGAVRMWVLERLGPFDFIMPLLDIFVGMLEGIAEFAKILSFSFRLFGNIFAGSVLLFVLGSMIPIFLQTGIGLFELFVGAIQALVFGMLTMVFMSMATQSHDEHEGEGASAH
jgi:F-type H+-transporting ATPase subunit a